MGQLASLAGCVYKLAAATELIELSESGKLVLHVICLTSVHLWQTVALLQCMSTVKLKSDS